MWKMVKLGDVCDFQNGFAFKSSLFKEDGSPILRISNIQQDKIDVKNLVYFCEHDYEVDFRRYRVEQGDLLIAMSGATTGKLGFNSTEQVFYLNQRVGKFAPKQSLNKKFLYYLLSTKVEENLSISKGAAQPNLSTEQIKNIDFLLPPLAEQQRIVAKLDAAFAGIDEIANNTKKRIDSAKAIFENSVKQYFSIENAQCEVKKLSEMTTYFNGLTYSPKDVGETGTVVLRSSNIQNGRMDFSDIVRVNKTIKEKLFVQPTDILICSRNGSKALIGKCSLVGEQDEPMTFGTFMMIVRGENNNYLQWFFKSKLFKEQIAQGENTAINQITRYMLDDVVLPVPDTATQVVISNNLEAIDKQVRRLQVIYQNKINELHALKSAILVQKLQSEAA